MKPLHASSMFIVSASVMKIIIADYHSQDEKL